MHRLLCRKTVSLFLAKIGNNMKTKRNKLNCKTARKPCAQPEGPNPIKSASGGHKRFFWGMDILVQVIKLELWKIKLPNQIHILYALKLKLFTEV